jgi:hypothetical protein
MARKKNGLFCLLNPSKVARLLGGANVDGFLEGWFKTAKHRFGLHRFEAFAVAVTFFSSSYH